MKCVCGMEWNEDKWGDKCPLCNQRPTSPSLLGVRDERTYVMAHDDIPEDRQESYPCECGGNIVKKGVVWECDTCDISYLGKDD